MKIGVLKETVPGESRVAASPDTVKAMIQLGANVLIEAGAGTASHISDADFKAAGATIEKDPNKILKSIDILLKVQPNFAKNSKGESELASLKRGAIYIGLLGALDDYTQIQDMTKSHVTAFSMEKMPRISRAQNMDVLSSQSNLAGYQAVLDAVAEFDKVLPMMMTAAGTIKPANVLILGAGVAGLQAIATAKRLGAVVSAFDVRPAVKEQVESLGATFIEVASEETSDAETKGGYAKEMSEDYKRKQTKLIADTIKTQDIIITTALIPGKPAPELITEAMVKSMKPGSVIVDLAVSAGGNCKLSELDKVVTKHGVKLVGYENVPSRVPVDASALYAKNILNFLNLLIDKEKGVPKIDVKDEIIAATMVMHQGKPLQLVANDEKPIKTRTKKAPAPKKATPKKVQTRKPHTKKTQKAPTPIKKVGTTIKKDTKTDAWEEE